MSVGPDGAVPEGGVGDEAVEGPAEATAQDEPLRGLRAIAGEDFSFAEAVGGVRGLVESTAPGLVFVVAYVMSRDLMPSLLASLGVALAAVVVRLVQRTPVTQAFSGVLGVGIGVVWAWRTGQAQDYFAWGLWVNVVWFVGALASILARWPAVGVIVAFLRSEDMSWRTDPAAVRERRRFTWATWLWVAVFGARLAVQVPLWFQGEEAIGWLGTAKLVMGVPLFAVGLWVTWLLVGSPAARADRPGPPPTPPR